MEESPSSADTKDELDQKNSLTSNQKVERCDHKEELDSTKANDDKVSPSPGCSKNVSGSPARQSPEPACSICLGQLQNKSFTDSCFHTFCFTCLLEWSKVKPECPLCKQRFKSIVHNVRSIEDYDQYYITSRGSQTFWDSAEGRRFRYSSTLTTERILERRRRVTLDESVEAHRLTYAPHSVSSQTIPERSNNDYATGSEYRRRIYEQGLWVMRPPLTFKFRSTSPEFFRQNPACTHRLIPFLTRELIVLLHNSETRAMFVLDLILALIMRYDIRSQEFFMHIQSYLGDRTSHFIHEFYNYASSPFDLTAYDQTVTYECLESYEESIVLSSPGSDIIPLTPTYDCPSTPVPGPSTSRVTCKNQQSRERPKKRVTKIYLKRNQENDSWNVLCPQPSSSYAAANSPENIVLDDRVSNFLHDLMGNNRMSNFNQDDDDDDCVIVEIKRKPHQPPEIVQLTDSDDDISAVQPVGHTSQLSDVNSDIDVEGGYASDIRVKTPELCDSDYEQPSPISRTLQSTIVRPCQEEKENSKRRLTEPSKSNRLDSAEKRHRKKHNSFSSGSKRCLSASPNTSESDNPERCPSSKIPNSKSPSLSPYDSYSERSYNQHYDSSTETSDSTDCDWSSMSRNDYKVKKLKLRSVVSHISIDHHYSRSSNASSSGYNKKHKKHKKKRKHEKRRHHKHSSHSKDRRKD